VNWDKCNGNPGQFIGLTNIAISEFFENITSTDDIGKPFGITYTIGTNGKWRESSIDLLLYVFAKGYATK